MKVVYIAGPFRASTAWEIQQNVRRAEEMALDVAKLGAMPLCPHKNTEHFHGLLSDTFWLIGTLELMCRCDAVMVLPEWAGSAGTKGEIAAAEKRGIPVFHMLSRLEKWLRASEEAQA
jgi:hypothetical protein